MIDKEGYREFENIGNSWSPLRLEFDAEIDVPQKWEATRLPESSPVLICLLLTDYARTKWQKKKTSTTPAWIHLPGGMAERDGWRKTVLTPHDKSLNAHALCAVWNEVWNILKRNDDRKNNGHEKTDPSNIWGAYSDEHEDPGCHPLFAFRQSPDQEKRPILTWANWGNDLRFETYDIVGHLYLPIRDDEKDAPKFPHRLLFDIRPRFGDQLYFHMLSRVFGRGEMRDHAIHAQAGEHGSLFLLGLFWLAAFEKAFRNGLPRLYVDRRDNRSALRGRLDIGRQLRNHLAGRRLDRISCHYRELSFDNVIGRTLRWCNRILRGIFRRTDTSALRSLSRADQLLASMGVPLGRVSVGELEHIHYTSMAEAYRPLVRLSQALIAATPERSGGELKEGKTFLFSMTELWEYYVLDVLEERLDGYSLTTANDDKDLQKKLVSRSVSQGGKKEEELFKLVADILVHKGNRTVAILDAKYKWVTNEKGRNYGVKSEDVYQLTTYMTRYSAEETPGDGQAEMKAGIPKETNGDGQATMKAGALIYPWPLPFAFRQQRHGDKEPTWNHDGLQWEAGKEKWKLHHGHDGGKPWDLGLLDFVLPIWGSHVQTVTEQSLPWNRPIVVPNADDDTTLILGEGWKCDNGENSLKYKDNTVVSGLEKDKDKKKVPPSDPVRHLEDAIEDAEKNLAERVVELL